MKVLVVGGAGYIGSHCVKQLQQAGHAPVVLDNLVYGHRAAVAAGVPFYDAELGDEKRVGTILKLRTSRSSCILRRMPTLAKASMTH